MLNKLLIDLSRLQDRVAQGQALKERLEQTLQSYAALEAQHKEHLLACTEQKTRLQQHEQDLKTLQAQHSQAKIRCPPLFYDCSESDVMNLNTFISFDRLEAASINLQKKELDFDEQTVVLRETKRQMLDLQVIYIVRL
jgi:hypothetical protein